MIEAAYNLVRMYEKLLHELEHKYLQEHQIAPGLFAMLCQRKGYLVVKLHEVRIAVIAVFRKQP